MSRGVISTARPGLIGRLLRIDDWRSIELWADVLVIDRGVWRETVALDKIVDWMIASRLFWSELRLRLDDGRQVSLRGASRRRAFGGALEGALLGVRRNDILALSRSLGEALSAERYLSRSDMRLFAVGDDWQSIYRFAGADIGLISHFADHFGKTATVELDLTFRMPDRLTDLASAFVQRNPVQTARQIKAIRAVPEPVVHLHWHPVATIADGGANGDHRYSRAAIDHGLAAVLATVGAETNDRQEVILLGRYNFQEPSDLARLQRAHPHLTVHAAKGLEADVVVVLDLSVGRHGFPSGVTDDPVLSLVLADSDPFPHAEERRLFYVALTRAKRCVHLIVPRSKPSPFAKEIAEEKKSAVRQHGKPELAVERCRDCGGAMILRRARTDFIGCTNFPLCRGTRRAPPRSEGAPAAAPRVPSPRHTSALRDIRPPA